MDDNNWIPERVKTWMVVITMIILIGGSLWGFIAMHQWKAEREAIKMEQKESE